MKPEFSRPIAVDRISASGTEMGVEANEAERAALAERFGLVSIGSLTARLRLKAIMGGTQFRVRGEFQADVVQTCVVTLEPVPAQVEGEVEAIFGGGEDEDLPAPGSEIELSFDEADPPEPIVDGAIDLGELVAEHLSLALDPFPRKVGAVFERDGEGADEPEVKPNPFAVLAQLRQKKG